MSKLDTNHVVNLDLVKDRVNSVIKFGLADVETSDFYLGLYNNGSRVFDKDYIVTLYIVKPNGTFRNIELEPKVGLKKYYCNLPDTLKNIPGEYVCQAMIFDNLTGEKKISKSKFKYSVSVDLASEMAGIIDEEEQESILTNVLNRLLTLENPVEPYATQKHVDECVSTLTEEIDTIKVKDTEQDDRLFDIESKNIEQDERLNAVESKNTEQDNRLSSIEEKNNEQDGKLTNIEEKDIAQDNRLSNIETKDVEQDNRVVNIESKNAEQDNRLTSIEEKDVEQDKKLDLLKNKVDGIDEKIVDTIEPSLDNYGNRLDALETKDIAHESRITNVEAKNTEQDNRLNSLESKDLVHESRLTNIESKNTEQDEKLNNVESKNIEQDSRLDVAENRLANIGNDITNTMQPIIDEHTSRLDAIEAIDVVQDNRLDVIEVKNQQQDDRLLDIEKVNNRQDIDIKCLYGASQTIDVTKEGNSIYLQNSNNGFAVVDEIQGNTLVNCNKEPNKELILNGNINTSNDNAVTLTEGVDGGLVDVALEGNTLVNVSKTKDSTAITKAYTVENSDNHIALQGDIDGDCRPVIAGNTLWIDNDAEEVLTAFDETKNLRLQSSFENNLVTQEMIDSGEEEVGNLGKYRAEYKVTGKNKFDVDNVVYHTIGDTNYYGTVTKTGNSFTYQGNKDNADGNFGIQLHTKLKPNTTYYLSHKYEKINADASYYIRVYTRNSIKLAEGQVTTFTTIDDDYYIFNFYGSFGTIANCQFTISDIQLEEGDTSTEYEPYKEYTKTLYLNSPLLGGDTIEEKDGGIYHVHRSEKIVLDGSNDEKITIYPIRKDGFTSFLLSVPEVNCIDTKFTNVICNVLPSNNKESYDRCTIPNIYKWIDTSADFVGTLKGDNVNVRQWLQQNPATVVYQLTEPQYELIEQSNLAIPSYTNGHLDFNTAVPVEKVNFLPFSEELTYLYANTQYTVQFVSDKAVAVDITLGGTQLLAQNIAKGLNRISITTPETLADNKLVINGVGANISKVVATDTNREFGYFEGMKSVGECEELEVKSNNKNLFNTRLLSPVKGATYGYYEYNPHSADMTLSITDNDASVDISGLFIGFTKKGDYPPGEVKWLMSNGTINSARYVSGDLNYISFFPNEQSTLDKLFARFNFQLEEGSIATGYILPQSNTRQLTREPLRGLPNGVKDKYVLIDGRWHIERKCKEIKPSTNIEHFSNAGHTDSYVRLCLLDQALLKDIKQKSNCLCDTILPINSHLGNFEYEGVSLKTYSNYLYINVYTGKCSTDVEYENKGKDRIKTLNPTIICELASPVYEPIDYNPLEVYSEVTHITTNSTIPTNITVKNTGFNCLLKPSTTYTISSNLGLNTVTTPTELAEDCLRFMDTDTSDVTTMKDVLILEGDWTTKADLIPANFSGIESAFEQEYDEEVGKYKVNAKVANEDKTKENNMTFYINEPLRGAGDVKDRVYVKDDKVVVERNCASVTFDGSEDEVITPIYGSIYNKKCLYNAKISKLGVQGENLKSNTINTANGSTEYYNQGIYLLKDNIRFILNSNILNNIYTVSAFKQWLQQNPTTVVYQLAEPTYEEVEYNDTKLFIESFKNSTLFYNSNVPVTSKLYYSYSVPIVDTVAQTANVTDQQDSMIIDLATQCAIMEMYLM